MKQKNRVLFNTSKKIKLMTETDIFHPPNTRQAIYLFANVTYNRNEGSTKIDLTEACYQIYATPCTKLDVH